MRPTPAPTHDDRATGSGSASGSATAKPKASRKCGAYLLPREISTQALTSSNASLPHSGEPAAPTDNLRGLDLLQGLWSAILLHVQALYESYTADVGEQGDSHRQKNSVPALAYTAHTFCLSHMHDYLGTFTSSMLARYSTCFFLWAIAGPSTWLLHVLVGRASQVLAALHDRCLCPLQTVLLRLVQLLAHIQNRMVRIPYTFLAGCSTTSRSRVGPKSDRISCRRPALFTMLLWLSFCHSVRAGATDARVDTASTSVSEVSRHSQGAKPSGTRTAIMPTPQSHLTKSGKRSSQRAYARACRMGGTPYRGRWRPLEWFQPTPLRVQSLGPRRLTQIDSSSTWKTINWNAGGLTANIYQELQTFLRLHDVDLAIMQETKWRFDSSWSSTDYHYIHSQGLNKEDKVAGVLTIIAAKHAKASDIQYSVLHPGRLLHVRLPRGQSHVDVLNCYQYAVNDREGVFERRFQLLSRLQKCLHGLPQRNSLILGGDLNSPVVSSPPTSGPCVLNHNLMYYRDHKDLLNILQTSHLCVLNTWTKPQHGQLATYTFGKIATQIDFLVTRRRQASSEARRAQPLTSFPVGAWREGGNHHPILSYIAVPKYIRHGNQDQHKEPRFDQETLRRDISAPEHCTPCAKMCRHRQRMLKVSLRSS